MSEAWSLLQEQVAARGLDTLGAVMKTFAQPGAFDPLVTMDNQLVSPPNLDRLSIMRQLVRRGLDPTLIRALLPMLDEHPLERALVAWDVLGGAILAKDDPLVDELRAAARPLKTVLPPGRRGIDLNRTSSVDLIKRFSGTGALKETRIVELFGAVYEHKLAAFGELQRRGDDLVADHGVHVSLHSLGRVLQLAHLPSLASVYLDYLSRALGYRPAALSLCETLFDAELPQHIPGDAVQPGDAPVALLKDMGEYIVYRSYLAFGQIEPAWQLFEKNRQARSQSVPSVRLVLVRAHLTALLGRPAVVPLAELDRLCKRDELWRYAARVRVAAHAAEASPDSTVPLQLLHDFVAAFGNDRRCWHEALDAAPVSGIWKRDAARVLGREAQYLPHERSVWEVLTMFLANPATVQAVVDEIDARLNEQCRL